MPCQSMLLCAGLFNGSIRNTRICGRVPNICFATGSVFILIWGALPPGPMDSLRPANMPPCLNRAQSTRAMAWIVIIGCRSIRTIRKAKRCICCIGAVLWSWRNSWAIEKSSVMNFSTSRHTMIHLLTTKYFLPDF